jgi:hypothetical protein
VDLAGWQGVMRVWERPKTITVHVEMPELGVEADFDLPLTPEQGLEALVAVATEKAVAKQHAALIGSLDGRTS